VKITPILTHKSLREDAKLNHIYKEMQRMTRQRRGGGDKPLSHTVKVAESVACNA